MNNSWEDIVVGLDIFDTTLRDWSQKHKDYPTDKQAALIGAALADLWVEHIEIWVPAADNQTVERLEWIIKAIEATWKNPVLYWFCRCVKSDIDAVLKKMDIAKNKWVNIVVSWSELFQILRDRTLKDKKWEDLDQDEVVEMEEKILDDIRQQVTYAKKLFKEVRVCFEDWSMWKKEFLLEAIKVAGESWAWVVSIPDTLWGALPHEVKSLFDYLISNTKDLQDNWLKFAIHAHNDRWLALANSLSAITAWVKSIEWTLIWSWERVGNTNLKDLIWNIHTLWNWRIIEEKELFCNSIITQNLYKTCRIIHDLLWKVWDPYTAFVWELSNKTQVWIHQSLENKSKKGLAALFKKYWRITPYTVIDTNEFWVPLLWINMYTNLSWFSNLEACLKPYWIKLKKDDPIVEKILNSIKPDLDNSKVVYQSRIFTEYLIQSWKIWNIDSSNIEIDNDLVTVRLNILWKEMVLQDKMSSKDGILWTVVKAIRNKLGPNYDLELTEFSLNMQEWVHLIAQKYPFLNDIYQKLGYSNGDEQMWISNLEWVFIDNSNWKKVPFISIANDMRWDIANIKALLYAVIPLIYELNNNEKI